MEYLVAFFVGYIIFNYLKNKNNSKEAYIKSEKEIELEKQLSAIRNEKTNNSDKDKKKSNPKTLIIILSLLVIGGFLSLLNSSSESSTSVSKNTTTQITSTNNSSCSNWANTTANNAGQFADVLDKVVKDLNSYQNNALSSTQIVSNFASYSKKLESIQNNQKSVTPNSANESSNNWFLLAVDNLINGVYYISAGIETEYLPTLESGIEFVDMATSNVEKATSRINSC